MAKYIVRTRKVMTNKLLHRLQMVVDVISADQANIAKDLIRAELAKKYKSKPESIVLFGFRAVFGGGKSTGFALIYENPDFLKKITPKYRLARMGLATKKTGSRKQIKELKNKRKKVRGTGKTKVGITKKK
jgi:small subunit ribosomal protein S24e